MLKHACCSTESLFVLVMHLTCTTFWFDFILFRAYFLKCSILAENMEIWSTYPQGSFEKGAGLSGVWVQECWGVEDCCGRVLWIHLQAATW